MKDPISIFIPVWALSVSLHSTLSYKVFGKWKSKLGDLTRDINKFNAERGFDRSVDAEELVYDLIRPFRTASLQKYAEKQGISLQDYQRDVQKELGRPNFILGLLIFQLLVLFFTLGGVVAIFYFGTWEIWNFLFLTYLIFALNLTLFLIA